MATSLFRSKVFNSVPSRGLMLMPMLAVIWNSCSSMTSGRDVASKILFATALTAARRLATMLFSDVKGFTALSERLHPQEIVGFLNVYMTAMCKIVEEENGVVDKFIGDAIMAVFTLEGTPNHAAAAVRAGIRMQQRLQSLMTAWETDQPSDQSATGIEDPAQAGVADHAAAGQVWPTLVAELESTVRTALPAHEPKASDLARKTAGVAQPPQYRRSCRQPSRTPSSERRPPNRALWFSSSRTPFRSVF